MVVCAASFVTWAGFGAILPYLPVFLRDETHASLTLIGVIAASYAVGTFVFSSPMGRLSDAVGRKPVLVGGVCLYAVSTALFLATRNPAWFILFRLLEGIGAAAVGPAGQAFIADITPENRRSQAYGWLTSAQFGGLVIGPALAVPLYALGGGEGLWGFYAIFIFGSALSTATAAALLLAIREPTRPAPTSQQRAKRPPLRVLLSGPIVAFVIVAFTGHYVMGAFEVLWSIYLKDLGASMTLISITWIAFSVPMLFSWAGGRVADRGNRFLIMVSGYGVAACCWITYGLATSVIVLMVFNIVEGIAFAFCYPAKQAFLIQMSPRRWIGTITGIEATSLQLATLLGSLTAPPLYGVIGGKTLAMGGALALVGLSAVAPTLRRAWKESVAAGAYVSFQEAEVLAMGEGSTEAAAVAGPGQLGERAPF